MKNKLFLLILIMLFFITGCTNYTELDELGIIETLALDYINNNYIVTVQIIDSKSESNKKEESRKVLTAYGNTINESFTNLYLKSTKKLYFSHLETLLISKEIALRGLNDVFDFFIKNKESRNNYVILLVSDNNINSIINNIEETSNIPKLIEINNNEYGISSKITFEDFIKSNLKEGIEPLLPTIKYENNTIEIDNYAIFNNNTLTDYLTKEESIYYNFLNNKISKLKININCNDKKESIVLNNILVTKKAEKNNFNFNITFETDNYQNCNNDQIKSIIIENINSLLEKNNKVDFLGITRNIYENNYKYYNNNKNDLLKLINYQINIDITNQKSLIYKEQQNEKK